MMRALLVIGWVSVIVCIAIVHAAPAPSSRPLQLFPETAPAAAAAATHPAVVKQSLAEQARWLAQHGGVISSAPGGSWGKATPHMRQLSARLIEVWFRPAGYAAVQRALCFSQRESGLNPGAVSSTGDYGLPQANWDAHHRVYDFGPSPFSARARRSPANSHLLDPVYGVAVFWRLSDHGKDWHPWDGGRYAC